MWLPNLPARRLLGSHDSGLSSGSRFTWRGGTTARWPGG
jgi:hypothetical protein